MTKHSEILRHEAGLRRCGWYVLAGAVVCAGAEYWFMPEAGLAALRWLLLGGFSIFTELRWRKVRAGGRANDSRISGNPAQAFSNNADDDETGERRDFH
jgi:hypothetical protein